MKSERSWAGIICGFVLFIVVCLSLLLHMKGAFRASGNPELGLLFFFAAGGRRRAVSLLGRRVLRPLLGAILAAPVCMVTMRLFFVTHRTFWQEMAWVLSAVFWCALGALCFCLSAPGLIPGAVIHRANKLTQANRPRFSFARGFKIGAAADVFLVDENLRHGFNRFANGFFQSALLMPSA